MEYYKHSAEDVTKELGTSEHGLTRQQALDRLVQNGANELTHKPSEPLLKRVLKQLGEPMTLVLLAAAAVSGLTSVLDGAFHADVLIILIVVVINAVLGVYQESKAEQAIEALKNMTAPECTVIRDDAPVVVKSAELVVGDIIVIEAGDAIPADARITDCGSLQIEEAALTGESVPVLKTDGMLPDMQGEVPLADRDNMVYMGCMAVYGRANAVVTATGMATEMGKIAGALNETAEEKTPLQKKLHGLSKILTVSVLAISAFVFLFRLITAPSVDSAIVLDTFMIAVSLAVAAIPEGLSTVVTVVLAIGVTNMSKQKAVIRKLTAVETLGCAQIICSDKTGTLTQNKMTVTEMATSDEERLISLMALCSDAEPDDSGNAIGEPTECALVNSATSKGILKKTIAERHPRVEEVPFDSERKMMTVVCKDDTGYASFTKGAPDAVLARCTHILKDGEIKPFTSQLKKQVEQQNKDMADRALRVLAGAFRLFDSLPPDISSAELEQSMIFTGLVGMIDPVRPEVVEAVKECRAAGIRPVMITGDHRDTAIAIAKEIGIIDSADGAITGAQLDEMPQEEFVNAIERIGVYARVKPENKTRIVTTFRKKGFVVAMTGDGVNDAPSIKSADIGVGMGITGTDVTKNVSDMILADDNFATIVKAVAEGRRIYDNIRKAIQFLLASNLSEVISIFVATLLGFTILKPVHLLFINLITDTFPALALGMERAEPDAMQRPPRDPDENIFARGLGKGIILQGIMVSILTLAAYAVGCYFETGGVGFIDSGLGMTMAFITMSLCETFHSLNMRSLTHSIFTLKSQNGYLWLAMAASFLCTLAVAFIPPLAEAFELTPISPTHFFICIGISVLVIPLVEVGKFVNNSLKKR